MKKFIPILICFLVLNFGSLYIGNILQGEGPFSDWYQNLKIAPWTPPGWVFGAAWSTIMFCFSIYLALLLGKVDWKRIAPIFLVQFLLNVTWNPTFFHFQQMQIAMLILLALTIVVALIEIKFRASMKWKGLLLAPYFVWLLIAISLNGYAIVNN